jgi:hypothetical protein
VGHLGGRFGVEVVGNDADKRTEGPPLAMLPPNKRLKLAAPVVYGRIAFVNIPVRRRSLGAIR